jgi:hypothetical protein
MAVAEVFVPVCVPMPLSPPTVVLFVGCERPAVLLGGLGGIVLASTCSLRLPTVSEHE